MRIAFIGPTLRYGEDGIADYMQRLAGACANLGHDTHIIATGRNNWLKRPKETLIALDRAITNTQDFAPDVVSFQFDGRIFHPKAIYLPYFLDRFRDLTPRRHLMVHESWEGDEPDARFRRKIKGLAQKYSFKHSLDKIAPEIIHASNPLYINHLKQLGESPIRLPLFSNIPVSENFIQYDYSGKLDFVIFGDFRDQWDPSNFLLKLQEIKRPMHFHHIGQQRAPWIIESMKEACEGWASFTSHGKATIEQVSRLLLSSHFAISTYDGLNLPKSGVFAAYQDHGLSVIVPRAKSRAEIPPEIESDTIITSNEIEKIQNQRKRLNPQDTLMRVATQFLDDIN